jgi:hypothetical protein
LYRIRIAKLEYPAHRLEGNPVTKHQRFQMLSKFRVGDTQGQGPRPRCTKDEKTEVSKGLAPNNCITEQAIFQGHSLNYRIPLSMSFMDRGDTKKLGIVGISVNDSGFSLDSFQWGW